jgi:uncharacterized membrane protein
VRTEKASLDAVVTTERVTAVESNRRAYRLDAIDMVRGLVIVIMAIDHVRDFFLAGTKQDPMTDPNITLGLYLTRWITHFCAPVFVLLAGVSAGLMTGRKSPNEIARFLFTRGLWLIFVEIFVIATEATFSPGGIPQLGGLRAVSMQVIWAIGASMIVLSVLQRLGRRVCLMLGAAIVVGHNLLDLVWPASHLGDTQWPVWIALHSQMTVQAGPFLLRFVYPLIPWIGVMLLGFGISGVFERSAGRRDRALRMAGLAIIAAFVLIRAAGIYGDPNPWEAQPAGITATLMDFLNTTKYPPSLDYLLMTLGPAAVLCSFAEGMGGPVKKILVMFGRVPFTFYVAHFLLIHLLSVGLGLMQGFSLGQMMTHYAFYPAGYGIGLPAIYLVWMLVVVLLFPLCRWMADMKARRRDWWLSYL